MCFLDVRAAALLAIGVLLATGAAQSAPVTGVYVFGDSFVDTGNVNIATGGAQPAPAGGPYDGGRFSNGALWVETLAGNLGFAADAAPSLAGGNNFAFAGARSGTSGGAPGLLTQVGDFWTAAHPTADSQALYILAGPMNDLRDARSAFRGTTAADAAGRQAAADAAAANLSLTLDLLASRGARNVLLANVYDLGLTPEAAGLSLTAASSDATARFNALLPGVVSYGTSLGLDVSFFDVAGLIQQIVTDATMAGGATYGIANVMYPCAGFIGSPGVSCATSLFADSLHLSARTHEILAGAVFGALPAEWKPTGAVTPPPTAVPEPATGSLLLAAGLMGVAFRCRRYEGALRARRLSSRAAAPNGRDRPA